MAIRGSGRRIHRAQRTIRRDTCNGSPAGDITYALKSESHLMVRLCKRPSGRPSPRGDESGRRSAGVWRTANRSSRRRGTGWRSSGAPGRRVSVPEAAADVFAVFRRPFDAVRIAIHPEVISHMHPNRKATTWSACAEAQRRAISSSRRIRSAIGGCVENIDPIFSPARNGLAIIRCA